MCRCINKNLLGLIALVSVILLASGSPSYGEDWAFRRSYHSHVLPPDHPQWDHMPVARSAYRVPVIQHYPGIAVRSQFRQNSILQRNGRSFDRTYQFEGYIQVRP